MRQIILSLFFFLCTGAFAQQPRIYFFPDFVKSRIVYKNKQKFQVMLNFDAANSQMLYKQDGVMMELANPAAVDTIFVGDRKFVYHQKQFCEVFKRDKGVVLLGWRLKQVHQGQTGAFGLPTQAHVQKLSSVDLSGMGLGANPNAGMGMTQYDSHGAPSLDVWKQKNDNTYYIVKDGKEYKLKTLKTVYKAFPQQSDRIKEFVSENKLDMVHADNAVQVIDFIFGL
ncbi:MAG: hypothetical protein MJZ83_00980 [Bacteroidaceae bacterium]|nr:hypothetical protein [Bacteroidaceae bacterium]